MNDKQIYELLYQQPRIRATEIAKVFNVELLVVSNALRTLVDLGDLVKHKEFDDQGRQSQVYELSDDFKKSREGKALASLPVTKTEVQKLPPAVVEQLSKPAQALAAAPGVRHRPGKTKVECALECMRANGGFATDVQLRQALGLESKASVAPYIIGPRTRGDVMRDGDGFRLVAYPLDSIEVGGKVILATRDSTPVPGKVKSAVMDMAEQHPFFAPVPERDGKVEVFGDVKVTGTISQTSPAPETKPMQSDPAPTVSTGAPTDRLYRCAIWSDGRIEIRKGYQDVILTKAELVEIMAFVADRRAA